LAVSIITHTELYAGSSVWSSSTARQELETIISELTVYPLTKQVSQQAGKLVAQHDFSLEDAIIAATAIDQNVPLATLNVKDFAFIDDVALIESK
jgi:predicted nucleic acid-binding protein